MFHQYAPLSNRLFVISSFTESTEASTRLKCGGDPVFYSNWPSMEIAGRSPLGNVARIKKAGEWEWKKFAASKTTACIDSKGI